MRALVIVLALAFASAAQAEQYTDQIGRFRMTIPDGWQKAVNPDPGIALFLASPRVGETFGVCAVQTEAVPGTEAISQDELDRTLGGQFTKEFWRDSLSEGGLKDVVVEDAGEEKQNGRNTYFAIAVYTEEDGTRVKVKAVAHFSPGRAHNVLCLANVASYPLEDAEFEIMFDSFTPLESTIIAGRKPQPPSATLSKVVPDALAPSALRAKATEATRAAKRYIESTITNRDR